MFMKSLKLFGSTVYSSQMAIICIIILFSKDFLWRKFFWTKLIPMAKLIDYILIFLMYKLINLFNNVQINSIKPTYYIDFGKKIFNLTRVQNVFILSDYDYVNHYETSPCFISSTVSYRSRDSIYLIQNLG